MLRKLFLLVSVLFLSSACTHFKVVHQATPNPFVGKTTFHVDPLDFSSTMISDKKESEWAAEGDSDDKKDWVKNKEETTKAYFARLQAKQDKLTIATSGAPAPGAVLVKPSVVSIQPGIWVGFAHVPTEVLLRVTLVNDKGEVADEIEIPTQVEATMFRPSFNQRMTVAAEQLADITLDYLQRRTAAQK